MRWSSLSHAQKCSVREQLSSVMTELRALPLPSRFLGCGSPSVCVDCRRHKRQSEPNIESEAEFNEFLLSKPRPRISQTHLSFLRDKCLRRDHRIVLTHGDLAPRNILVDDSTNGLEIVGIADWECGGAYPEYWEYIKALNTVSSIDEDDWGAFLPEVAIGRHDDEWAKNLVVEQATM